MIHLFGHSTHASVFQMRSSDSTTRKSAVHRSQFSLKISPRTSLSELLWISCSKKTTIVSASICSSKTPELITIWKSTFKYSVNSIRLPCFTVSSKWMKLWKSAQPSPLNVHQKSCEIWFISHSTRRGQEILISHLFTRPPHRLDMLLSSCNVINSGRNAIKMFSHSSHSSLPRSQNHRTTLCQCTWKIWMKCAVEIRVLKSNEMKTRIEWFFEAEPFFEFNQCNSEMWRLYKREKNRNRKKNVKMSQEKSEDGGRNYIGKKCVVVSILRP